MSGDFVQRGHPAIIHKSLRAKAAVLCGADLVLELPVTAALSSAEGFAARGVEILSPFCNDLCFGAESDDPAALLEIAKALLCPDFPPFLRAHLEKGLSFPAARQAALEEMGLNGSLVTQPNNILAIEYCKAILSQQSSMTPFPILRQGSYHATAPDPENPSATALRQLLTTGGDWSDFISPEAKSVFENASIHTLAAGGRAILARLRTMDDSEFEALPYGSEGLWRKLMHAARQESTLEDILTAVKSKRYTRTRLDRMVMCAFLGLTAADLNTPATYVRVLAFNDTGREILKKARQTGAFINIGQTVDHPYQILENRCTDLYGLFAETLPPAGLEQESRVYYKR
jgi:predicted nucleotidyltransferase